METPPEPSIDDRELPQPVAENFRIALGLDEPPATLSDWADATVRHLADAGVALGVEELCLTESSRHEARIGDETYHFACVLDTLLVPFVVDEAAEVSVTSRSPASDAVVEFSVTRDDVVAAPESAVVSFGIAADVSAPDDRGGPLAGGETLFCPYINAFPDESAYEDWAATADAETIALAPDAAFALGRRIAGPIAE